MALLKVVKNKAYFKRYQVALRRRREGKTDYFARRNMVRQAKDKYNTAKYRLVVRMTNTKVVCQVVSATIIGDRVLAQALSTELPRYGVKVGLKNYAAAYCTGLLCARRALKAVGLDEMYQGVKECDGEEFHVEEDEEGERRPLKAVLDVGLARTTVGARVFSAMKGAVDGGLHVPHSTKRFPGFTPAEDKNAEDEYDAAAHRDRIMGKHVAEYMDQLEEEAKDRFEKQFSKFIKAGVKADGMEAMYQKCHAAIRANPAPAAKKEKRSFGVRMGAKIKTPQGKVYSRPQKLALAQRKSRVYQKLAAARARAMAA